MNRAKGVIRRTISNLKDKLRWEMEKENAQRGRLWAAWDKASQIEDGPGRGVPLLVKKDGEDYGDFQLRKAVKYAFRNTGKVEVRELNAKYHETMARISLLEELIQTQESLLKNIEDQQDREKVALGLQNELALVTDQASLDVVLKKIKEEDLQLVTKRTGVPVGDFSQDWHPRKAYYLIYDGRGIGRCQYENLYKVLKVE